MCSDASGLSEAVAKLHRTPQTVADQTVWRAGGQHTVELPYWTYNTDHALVVVGCDEAMIYLNDPYYPHYPHPVSRGDLELAWAEREYAYALIMPGE